MENIQINGQRIWGPPKDWIGQPPPHGTEIFIKNIPDDVFEDELYYLFSQVGKVYEVRLPVHWTGVNKGYAFVRFTRISEADAAIERVNFYTIRQGRKIKVERSLDNTRLFLSSVPIQKTGEEIKADLLTVVENVKTVYVYPAIKNPSIFRGYAFVEFLCHRDAAIAKRILTPDVLFMLFEKKCVAAWANPLPFLSKETLKNINMLFMRNIPNSVKTMSIKIAIDSLISPDNVNKVKRVNDYAFLTFRNHEMAERALNKMKNNSFLVGMNAVQVEWAIPRELAKSFFTKNSDVENDEESESSYNLKAENNYSFKKILEALKDSHSEDSISNYINMNCVNASNASFGTSAFAAQLRIMQNRPKESESLLYFNETETEQSKSKMEGNFLNDLDGNNMKQESELSSFLPMDYFSPQVYNEYENLITEFPKTDSQYRYRDMHVKTWLQSLSYPTQFTSCATSPSLTSPSTGSSTNLSCKLDENCSQFSTGSGVSMGYDSKTSNTREPAKRHQQIVMF